MKYPQVNTNISYPYHKRHFLDSMAALRNIDTLFVQKLGYDASGQITSQKWKQYGRPQEIATYDYDGAKRLELYTNANSAYPTWEYNYDAAGNRKGANDWQSGRTQTYSYTDANGPDRLTMLTDALRSVSYSYTPDGAMKDRQSFDSSGSMYRFRQERFRYGMKGLQAEYSATGEVYGQGAVCWTDVQNMPKDLWQYRYSAAGEREQKRQLRAMNAADTKGWVYYLLGGYKDQLAVYHGLEGRTGCDTNSDRVYLYPVEYLTYGMPGGSTSLVRKPGGAKEYYIADHLGSTRMVLNGNGNIRSQTDYHPFGDILWQSSGQAARKEYISKEKDKESQDYSLSARQFGDDIGRFFCVDPLWEKYRDQSPYAYSFNNPLVLPAPSGMGPGDHTEAQLPINGGFGGGGSRARAMPTRSAAVNTSAAKKDESEELNAIDYPKQAAVAEQRAADATLLRQTQTRTSSEIRYTFTKSAGKHLDEVIKRGPNAGQLSRPYMRSSLTIQEIMATGKGIPGLYRRSADIKDSRRPIEGRTGLFLREKIRILCR